MLTFVNSLRVTTRDSTGKPVKTVQMMGAARTDAPVPPLAPGVERWGMNALIVISAGPQRFFGCTRWFDLHHQEHILGRKNGSMWPLYQRSAIPVVLWRTYDDLPASVAYPVEAVRAMFGWTRLFASTLDWQIALALYEGFEAIELYGFAMRHPAYRHQVASGRWWLQQCAKRDVVVTFLSESVLAFPVRGGDAFLPRLETPMYGWETTDRARFFEEAPS